MRLLRWLLVISVPNKQARLFYNVACYITPSSTFFDCLFICVPEKNGFKYPALLINIFILYRTHNLDLLWWARHVSICSIYFICQKSSHRFLPIFFSDIEDIVLIEFIKQKVGSPCSFTRKRAFTSLWSLVWGKSITFCARALFCAR